jgi:hypothetical protein
MGLWQSRTQLQSELFTSTGCVTEKSGHLHRVLARLAAAHERDYGGNLCFT